MSSTWGMSFGPAWGDSWGVYAVDAAEGAAVDSGDISRAFAVDYSPLKQEDEELALLALYAVLPKAA